MRSPTMLYCILCVITQGWNRMGQTTTNMPHALGGITMRQTGSHQNEGNFLYFRKYRTKVLLLVCIFSKMSFSYSCIWSVFFLFYLAKVLNVCMYFFVCGLCVCVVLLLDICAFFFSRPDLEGKIFQWGLSFNLVHKHWWTSTRLLCVRLWLPYRFIVILPPSLVIYLFYNLVATITPHFEEVSPYSSWIKFTKFTRCSLILNSWSFGSL